MKRLSIGILTALLAAGLGLNAVAAPPVSATHGNIGTNALAQASDQAPPPNFGSPPSGQIPILYNDHHVYSKPDVLKQDRVLSALIRGNTILIPLRSMFEQMGATVSYDAATRTVDVSKAGADVKVTVGKPEVVINGETRPLDVPPIIYHGIVLVPVRVISEGMGAYVLWVPDRHIVVVRYIPPTPPPPPAPTPTASPTPTPMPVEQPYRGFVEAAFAAPRTYNEFSAGQYCRHSYMVSAAYMFNHSGFAIKADYRQDAFVTSSNVTGAYGNQYTGFSTIDGGYAYTPVFLGKQTNIDARLEYQVATPRIYVGVGYLHTSTNYGYPGLNAVGFGVEKLPNQRPGINLFGSVFYYPSASGNYTITSPTSSNFGRTYRQQYNITKFDVGVSLDFRHSPVYIYAGFAGDEFAVRQNAPIGQTHSGPYIGLGANF